MLCVDGAKISESRLLTKFYIAGVKRTATDIVHCRLIPWSAGLLVQPLTYTAIAANAPAQSTSVNNINIVNTTLFHTACQVLTLKQRRMAK